MLVAAYQFILLSANIMSAGDKNAVLKNCLTKPFCLITNFTNLAKLIQEHATFFKDRNKLRFISDTTYAKCKTCYSIYMENIFISQYGGLFVAIKRLNVKVCNTHSFILNFTRFRSPGNLKFDVMTNNSEPSPNYKKRLPLCNQHYALIHLAHGSLA